MGRTAYFLAVLFVVAGCGSTDSYHVAVEPHGQKIVTGRIFRSTLESDSSFEWYKKNYESYTPDSASIVFLFSAAKEIHFLVFGGTWCGDTKRELPRFLKIASLAHIPDANIEIYGVDRSKESRDGLTEKYHIANVPTFIVLSEGKEIGRIVEHSEEGIEFDLVYLLRKK
jgi:thiol-disulfide isomerase/thioredoxin